MITHLCQCDCPGPVAGTVGAPKAVIASQDTLAHIIMDEILTGARRYCGGLRMRNVNFSPEHVSPDPTELLTIRSNICLIRGIRRISRVSHWVESD